MTKFRAAKGCRVRKLDGAILSPRGEPLPAEHPYYARLIRDGDLEPVPEGKIRTRNQA